MAYDFSQLHERLFVGANVNTPDDVREIAAAGITHVLDANTDDEGPLFPAAYGIALKAVPTPDDGGHKGVAWFGPAIDFAIGALSHPGFRVLAHCAAGVNRGPSLAFAILRAQGWSRVDAIMLIHSKRMQTVGGIAYRDDAEAALLALGWIK